MIRGDEIGAMATGINTSAGGRIGLQEAKMETETPESPQPETPEPAPASPPVPPEAPDGDETPAEGDDAPGVSAEAAAEVDKQAEPMGQDVEG